MAADRAHDPCRFPLAGAAGLVAVALSALAACSPPAQERQGSTLVFVTEDVPSGLDYDGPAAALPTSQTGMVNLMEPLFAYALRPPDAQGVRTPDFARIEGRLAQSWSFDAPSLTWTIRLRPGVRSCAGNVLSADDVVYTFARAKSVSGAAPIGWFIASVAGVKGFDSQVLTNPRARDLGDAVVKVDDLTVRIRQSEPNRLFLPAMSTFGALIFDSREARRHATAADSWSHAWVNNVAAPGFGAYCVRRWVKNDQLVLRANPHYFAGAPAIRDVVIKRIPQSSNRFVVLRTHQAQLAEHLTPREFVALRKVPGVRVAGVTGNEALFVHMNFSTKPFDNPKVRQAIAYATPYAAIIRGGYFGQATRWEGLTPATYPGYAPAAAGFRYDPVQARRLLAEAGYPGGRGLERYGAAFRLAYVAEKETTLGPIAAIFQTALREVGVPVELDPLPATQYGDRQLVKKDLPFALNDQEKPVVVDAGYAASLFFVSAKAGGINNMVNYDQPKVDALWAQARAEPDDARRNAALAQLQRQLAADVAWLPIAQYRTQWAMSDRLKGLAWRPDNAVRFADLRFAP
jgi:peptide/nickel transport system substrate-binding protein